MAKNRRFMNFFSNPGMAVMQEGIVAMFVLCKYQLHIRPVSQTLSKLPMQRALKSKC